MEIFAPFAADWYKPGHKPMYNQNTKLIFSNLTPRNDKNFAHYADKNARGVIVLGLRRMVMDSMVGMWKKFFKMKREAAVKKFARMSKNALGDAVPSAECWGELHDLGYLPVEIRALPEGILSPIGIPVYTIHNTVEKFFWVTNYIETVMSTESWKTITNATAAFQYKRVAMSYALATCDNVDHVNFQCHDFSLRGLSNVEDGYKSGIAHLASFTGTDNILAIEAVHEYYGIDDDQFVAGSIPASEHSVATTNISRIVKDLEEHFPHLASDVDGLRYLAEKEFLLTFITKIVPEGFCSYVADSYDYWAVLTRILPELKEEIMSRNGRLVVRPDSGDPVKVVAGYYIESFKDRAVLDISGVSNKTEVIYIEESDTFHLITGEGTINSMMADNENIISRAEAVGSIQVLWEIFGGEVNNKGYKVLDSHIGMIYGDSITVEREIEILKRLKANGFASSNIVFGVGSFTYQFNTRDTFGIAVKATGCFIDDYEIMVSKEPKTDPSKRSAKGFIKVVRKDGILHQVDNISFEEINDEDNLLQPIFRNGNVLIPQVNGRDEDFNDIRARLDKEVMNHLIEVK